MSHLAYIGFGSNLGDRKAKFREALISIEQLPKVIIRAKSRLYETDPVGLSDNGPKFLNAAILIDTELSARELLDAMRSIELALGKAPSHRSDRSRIIDLDLLLYGNQIIMEDDLQIPHPRMHQRAFVLAPLAELDPSIILPIFQCTIMELIQRLPSEELAKIQPLEDLG